MFLMAIIPVRVPAHRLVEQSNSQLTRILDFIQLEVDAQFASKIETLMGSYSLRCRYRFSLYNYIN